MSRASELGAAGLLERASALRAIMESCGLCPWRCGAARSAGERGRCGAGLELEVASSCVHGGEEPVLGGDVGVGNFFLAHCSLGCVFCQNHGISQTDRTFPTATGSLASEMLRMQDLGCPTVGFVSPTHYAPHIVEALAAAVGSGFRTPVVYNTNGFERIEVLRLLEDVIDIYLPDFKYGGREEALDYSGAHDYPAVALAAVREMWRQAGELETDARGVAVRGLLVRHLVLPNDLARTAEVLRMLAGEVSPRVAVSLMAQYNPLYRAREFPLLSRTLHEREYLAAVEALEDLGLVEGYLQDWRESPGAWVPDFDRSDPFGGGGG